jgi:ABC-type Fe3+/spermidine/putrescine transport system ATPase subunit
VLLNHGRIVQDGTPQDLFDQPASRFVAEFMGIENVIEAEVSAVGPETAIATVNGIEIAGRRDAALPIAVGDKVFVAVRAERLRLADASESQAKGLNMLPCRPRLKIYRGGHYDIELDTPAGTLVIRQDDVESGTVGDRVLWHCGHCIIGPLDSRRRPS